MKPRHLLSAKVSILLLALSQIIKVKGKGETVRIRMGAKDVERRRLVKPRQLWDGKQEGKQEWKQDACPILSVKSATNFNRINLSSWGLAPFASRANRRSLVVPDHVQLGDTWHDD